MGRADTAFRVAVEEHFERPRYYILVHGEPVPVTEHDRWRDWINVTERRVARTDFSDDLYVETWFTGVDHRTSADPPGPPLLWLTEVYRGGQRVDHYRLATQERAGAAHSAVASRLAAAMAA